MLPKFIDLPEKQLIGFGVECISILAPNKPANNSIGDVWTRLIAQAPTIPHRIGDALWGLAEMLPAARETGKLFYMAAAEVSNYGHVPEGMTHRTVPAGRYALFTHKGSLDKLAATMSEIYKTWLPSSKMQHRAAPDLERYDHRFRHDSEDSEFDIMIPIQPLPAAR